MATAADTANPVAVIRQNLAVMAPELKAALPKHVDEEKFRRVAMTAIQQNPDLQNADRRSLFGAIVRLAQDGLLPDGREAALVLFGGKAQAMPMIAGVLKKIRQSGEVAKVSAQVVYANDEFTVRYGFDEDVEHIPPALDKPRGQPIGAYATAVLKDGSKLLEVMSLEEIEKVRNVSRAKNNGPWQTWWSEMARKTVMRRLSKRLPMSTDLEDQIFSRDITLDADARELRRIEEPPAPHMGRLDMIEHQIADEEPPVESEVIEEQAEALEEAIDAKPKGRGKSLLDQIAPTPAEAKVAEIKAALEQADAETVEAVIAEAETHREALGDLMTGLEIAFDQARRRVGAKEAVNG